ncbi:MAG: hypothetical protein IT515_07255 [Burkholderiales bacterium]|nr:hypothetical protein [Burkholderiales bacterium]
MKSIGVGLLVAAALLAGLVSPPALADRGHVYGHGYGYRYGYGHGHTSAHFGFYLGGPAWWGPGYYYPAPYYYPPYSYPYYPYYPPVVTAPASPPVYIERGAVQAAPSQDTTNWWYYCTNPQGYYPYVKQCPGGWQRVAPQPPPAQ